MSRTELLTLPSHPHSHPLESQGPLLVFGPSSQEVLRLLSPPPFYPVFHLDLSLHSSFGLSEEGRRLARFKALHPNPLLPQVGPRSGPDPPPPPEALSLSPFFPSPVSHSTPQGQGRSDRRSRETQRIRRTHCALSRRDRTPNRRPPALYWSRARYPLHGNRRAVGR